MSDRFVQVILLTEDLEAEGGRLREAGFAVEPGGRHPGRGTENLIVPFDRQYLEILAVVDPAEAGASPAGRPVLDALRRRGPGLARWSVEPASIDATSTRLGLAISRRERERPDGQVVRWQAVAVDEAWEQPWRAAYMAWDDAALHPGARRAPHPNGASGLGTLEVQAPDPDEARRWVGGAEPDGVRIGPAVDGGPDLRLRMPVSDGRVVFEPGGWHLQR